MEFKVWVDGIQRVISGVNSETTCRDIVLCLAQATHQFGKFVLIEKWRNSERLLAPSESPLQLMNKWADYGNEVCFVMRRSDHHQQLQQQLQQQQSLMRTNGPMPQSNSHPAIGSLSSSVLPTPQHQINYHANNVAPHPHNPLPHHHSQPHLQMPTTSNATLRQSPAHLYAAYASSNALQTPNNGSHSPIHQTASNRMANTTLVNQPQPTYGRINMNESIENASRPKRPPPYNEAIAKSSLLQSQSPVLGQTSPTPNAYAQPHSSGPIVKQPQHSNYGYTDPSASGVAHHMSTYGVESETKGMNGIYGEIGIPQVLSNRNLNIQNNNNNNHCGYDNRMSELTSNLEIEKMRKKNLIEKATITDYHKGMNGMRIASSKDRPWDDKEVAKLTAQEHVVINDEIQHLQREKERIELEKSQLNSNLNETDSKIAKCRQRIQQLMDEIKGKEVTVMKENERIRREEENAKEQLNSLKKQINQSLQDYEQASSELNSLQEEMDKLEGDLNERKKKIEKLTTEIKEANIEGLTLLPLEEALTGQEDENNPPDCLGDNRFGNRCGSTRRISGCPRELGSAAPTSKNPHGVWV